MKKPICIVLIIALLCGVFAACTIPTDESSETTATDSTSESFCETSTTPSPQTTEPPRITETTSYWEQQLKELREKIKNDEELDWLIAKADPLPEFYISDVMREEVSGHAGDSYNCIYYGTYGDYKVFYVQNGTSFPLTSGDELELSISMSVGEVTFCFPIEFSIVGYREGAFYSLNELYDLGEITNSELSLIREYHRRLFQLRWMPTTTSFTFFPCETDPADALDPNMPYSYPEWHYQHIIYNETDLMWLLNEPEPLPAERLLQLAEECGSAKNHNYYGTYNGYEVWRLPGITAEADYFHVGTKTFYNPGSGFSIVVRKGNEEYTLREAYYVHGIISDEDLEEIHYHHWLGLFGMLKCPDYTPQTTKDPIGTGDYEPQPT